MKKKGIIIFLIIIVIVLMALQILLSAGGIFSKEIYLEPWQKDYSKKFTDPRIQLVSHGLLAANGHNMQPWKIKLDKKDNNVFYLYADSERLTKQVDPYARQTMVSQGTFLEYMRVAADKLGYSAQFVLFPDGEYDESKLEESMQNKPVAKIILTESEKKDNMLYDYMFLSDTNREKYKKDKLTYEQTSELQSLASDENISIKIFQDDTDLKKIGDFVNEGAKIEAGVTRINEETAKVFRSNEDEKNKYRYGFSVEGQGTSGITKYILQGVLTLFPSINDEKASSDRFIKSTEVAVENTPGYAMIITKDNSRINQVKAGMIYSRVVLVAHSLGLVVQPPSQILEEYPEMDKLYKDVHSEYAKDGGTIQMLLRIGKPTKDFPQSMRRDVMDLIIK